MIKINIIQHYSKNRAQLKLHVLVMFIFMMSATSFSAPIEKITFWSTQQKGTNIFNRNVTSEDIKAAKKYGIKFIRLAPDKFLTSHRDFLIGDADNYRELVKEDLEKLKKILDICHQEGMPVVISMLSLPGSRWKQNNQDKDDLRIWQNETYQTQAAHFWQDLANTLKDHPAIVGYNILNEPHPERMFANQELDINQVDQKEIQQLLYDLYHHIIQHIRVVDKNTPIILDSSAYADAQSFDLLQPHTYDENILYSFHMYEPYEYTNYEMNKGKFQYPGTINGNLWDQQALQKYLSAVITFQKNHKIDSNKIVVGEFGGHRMTPGLDNYFQDLIVIFTKEGWHFAFYAFREDTWDGMDYELGDKILPWSYWHAVENNKTFDLTRKDTHPAFTIIKKALDDKVL